MTWNNGLNKIDNQAVLGLAGVSNSLAYKVHEIEKHFHNAERWYGIAANQTDPNPWAASWSVVGIPTAYRATAGTGADFGTGVQIWGVNDTLSVSGVSMTKLDLHRIFITAASQTSVYGFRIVWSSTAIQTIGDAITAGQFGGIPIIADANQGGSIAVITDIMMPRISIGVSKIWVQVKNITNAATIDFYVGLHGYQA